MIPYEITDQDKKDENEIIAMLERCIVFWKIIQEKKAVIEAERILKK